MREIKFRAFCIKDMIEGLNAAIYPIVSYSWGIERELDEVTLLLPNLTLYKIKTEYVELMQYTGVKDKNGKEIYEGDILSIPAGYGGDNFYGRCIAEIKYDAPEFYPHRADGSGCCVGQDFQWYECEVVGNIYENPELMEASMSEKMVICPKAKECNPADCCCTIPHERETHCKAKGTCPACIPYVPEQVEPQPEQMPLIEPQVVFEKVGDTVKSVQRQQRDADMAWHNSRKPDLEREIVEIKEEILATYSLYMPTSTVIKFLDRIMQEVKEKLNGR